MDWNDNATHESGFKIERKTGSAGTYAQIDTVGANVVSYNDTELDGSTQYYYRVRAYNGAGHSAYSNEANVTTPAPSGNDGGDGGCFIATAAFGSSMIEELDTLKRFRDLVLLPNPLGKKLVQHYYRISPPVADLIARHEGLRTTVRGILLPLVGLSWLALNLGPAAIWLLILFLGFGLCAILRAKK